MQYLSLQFCCITTVLAQYDSPSPPRLNIPGAIPLPALRLQQQSRAVPINTPGRVRKPARPQQQAPPQIFNNEPRFIDDAKPVNEEPEDEQYSLPSQPSPPRALFTHEPQEIDTHSNAARFNVDRPKPVQQQVHRPAPVASPPQPQRPRAHHFDQDQRPHQKVHNSDDKPKKPVAQILRKYREEHPDGSITWGFENDDGKNSITYKKIFKVKENFKIKYRKL